MVNAAPLGCIFWDENGNFKDCNQETLSMFGFSSKEEFLEKFEKMSPEYQPDGRHSMKALRDNVRKAFVSGSARTKWTHMTTGGDPLPMEVTLIRVPKGEDYILAAYLRDMREQEAAQAKMDEAKNLVERYTNAKNEFINSVSHEIRTPLNAIVAMARTVGENGGLNEDQQNLVNQGMRSVKLLTSAIETILDFSRLDSGRMPLEIGDFSVRELVRDISGMMQDEAREKSLYLNAAVDSGVPELLSGDSARLQQALLNIIANAVKFTETGGVEINVFSEKTSRGGEVLLTFKVRDTGIGISEKQMPEMFKPLYSGDTAYSRKHSGLGMGLSISNSLAALMGGKITFESRQSEGSTFNLTVPLSVPAKKTAETQKEPEKHNAEALRGLRVLVAEDNNINQMIIEALLSSAGIDVTLADNGIKALEILQDKTFDVVLMDIQMPEMDGLTATARIRADGRYDDLPILAMTANAGAEHLEESIKAGMNGHLTKPVDVEQLYKALIKWSKRE
jgi:signal transduction histidine kinase/ActR/RegA family two-component response regulator